MKKRIAAALMAAVMTITSLPVNTISALAAEEGQDVIMEEPAEIPAQESGDGETEGSTSQEQMETNSGESGIDLQILDQEVISEEEIPEEAVQEAQEQETLGNGEIPAEAETEESELSDAQSLEGEVPDPGEMTVIEELDTRYEAVISESDKAAWFAFTAPEAGEYYFFSEPAGEEERDTLGYLYNEAGEPIQENDDYSGLQFGIKAYLEQGERCFLKAAMMNSGDIGTFLVCVKKTVGPEAITEIRNFNTVYPAGISSAIRVQAVLSYEDGGTETVSLYDTDSNGNELTGYILENDGLYLEGALPEGTYTVRFQCGGAWKDVEIQAVPVEAYLNSEYAAGLELGQEQSFGGASQNVIYDFAFTAPAQGRYSFSLTGSESRLSLYNLQGEWLDDSDRACTAWLEEGERILVRVNCGGNGETESLTARMGAEVAELSVELPEQVVYGEDLYESLKVTLQYTDAELPSQVVELSKTDRDSYGNQIEVEITGENLGPQTVAVRCGEIEKTAVTQVVSRLESGQEYETLDMADQLTYDLTVPEGDWAYLKLLPAATGDYRIEITGDYETLEMADSQENSPLSWTEQGDIASLEAGKEYLLSLEGRPGTALHLEFTPVKSVAGLELVSAPQELTEWNTWAQNVVLKVQYSDETEEEITGLYGTTQDGRYFNVRVYDQNGGEYTDIWEGMGFGLYTVEISCGGKSVRTQAEYVLPEDAAVELQMGENRLNRESVPEGYARFILPETGSYSFTGDNGLNGWIYLMGAEENRAVPFTYDGEAGEVLIFHVEFYGTEDVILNIERMPRLSLGSNSLEGITAEGKYFEFTTDAERSGYAFKTEEMYAHVFQKDGSPVMDSSSGDLNACVLEPSTTYQVVVGSYSDRSEGTLTIEKVPAVINVSLSLAYEDYWARIDSFRESDVRITLAYADGSQGELRGWNKDAYGYGLTSGWLTGPDGSGTSLEKTGEYTYVCSFAGQNYELSFTAAEPAPEGIEEAFPGYETELAPYGKKILKLTPEQDGLYQMSASMSWMSVFDGESLELLEEFWGQGSVLLTGGKTYYLRAANDFGETVQFSLQSGAKAESVEILQNVTSYPAGIPYSPLWGIRAKVTYSDGSVQEIGELAGSVTDENGNSMTAAVKSEKGETIEPGYDMNGLEEGNYQVELSLAGCAVSYPLSVEPSADFFTESLTEGVSEFTMRGMNYYRLETDAKSWYLNFSSPVNRYVVDAETGTQCIGGSYSGSDIWDFMEPGKTYYAVFWASPGEAYYEEAGEKGTLEIVPSLSVTSLTLKEAETEFYFGDTEITENYTVTAEYADGSSFDLGPAVGIWTDPYGNSLGVQLFNEQGQEVEQYGILPPGSYTVWIYLGDQSLSYEAVIREREAIALVPGEQTLKIAPGESGLYTLPYLDTEKTRISLGEGTYVTYQAGPREDPLRYTGGGSDIYVKQEQGETVYLLIRNESEMEEIPANLLTVRELRTQVAAVPDTAVYAWGDLFLDGILLEKTYGEGTPLREYFDRGISEEGYSYQADFYQNGQSVYFPAVQPGLCTLELWQCWGNSREESLGTYEVLFLSREEAAGELQIGETVNTAAEAELLYDYCFIPEATETYRISFDREVEMFWQEEGQNFYSSHTGSEFYVEANQGTKMFFCFRSMEPGELSFSLQAASRSFTIEVMEPELTFTGEPLEPGVRVYSGETGEPLAEDEYSVSYDENINAGTGLVLVEGQGSYAGLSQTAYFQILPKDLGAEDIFGNLSQNTFDYDGQPHLPDITEIRYGERALTPEVDYTWEPEPDPVSAGDKEIRIQGKGNYTGQMVLGYVIQPRELERISWDPIPEQKYDPEGCFPVPVLRDGTKVLEEETDYTIEGYEDHLRPGEAYIVINGKGNYTGELRIPFKISAGNLEEAHISQIPDQPESGVEVCPALSVYMGESLLREGEDYNVLYENCVEPGTARAVITGMGSYTGSVTVSYTILPGTIFAENLSVLPLEEGQTMTPETGHGAVWYSWPPSERGSFLIYGTGNIKEIGLFRKLEDGSLENIKEETIELNSQGTLLGYPAEEGESCYIRLLSGADSVLVSLPASLNPGEESSQTTVSGTAAWYFVPEEEGTYRFTAHEEGSLEIYTESMDSLDEILLEKNADGLYQGTFNFLTGARYLILWSGEAAVRTLKAEKAEDVYTMLEEGENPVYIPAGATAVYSLPAGEGRRFVRTEEGIALNLSVGTREETGLYQKAGQNAIAYRSQGQELFLTVENTSGQAVTHLWTGKVPEAVTTVSREAVPEQILDGWEEGAGSLAELSTKYTGEDATEWEHRLSQGEDDYGYSWSLEIRGSGTSGEVEYVVAQQWMGEEPVQVGSFTSQVIDQAEELPYLKRGAWEEGISAGGPGMYYFVPAVSGTYRLELSKPAWMLADPQAELRLAYSQEFSVEKGENYCLLIAPEETAAGDISYTLKRQGESAAFTAQAGEEELVFTGAPVLPEITVKDESSGTILLEGEDYTLQTENAVWAGEKSLTVLGAGEYEGAEPCEISYIIRPADLSGVKFPGNVSYTYTGEPVLFREAGDFGQGYKVTTQDYLVVETDENLTDAGRKTVLLEGRRNFTGTKEVTYQISPRSIEEGRAEVTGTYSYTGEEILPELTVTLGGKTLQESRDYTVEYADHILPGDASFTVIGNGNYTGTLYGTFTISRKEIRELKAEPILDQIYDGRPKTPEVILKNGKTTLIQDQDYTLSYENNTEIGEARIYVSGKGNYKGSLTIAFDIVNETLEAGSISAESLEINREYAAAGQEMWYSYTGEKEDLLLIQTSGDGAARVKFYNQKGTLLERSWETPLGSGDNLCQWLWNTEEGAVLYLYVPEGTAFEVQESEGLQTEASAEKEEGTGLYSVSLEENFYEIFTGQNWEISAVYLEDGERKLQELTPMENQSWNSEAGNTEEAEPAEKYPFRYDISESGRLYLLISGVSGEFQISRMPSIQVLGMQAQEAKDTYRRFDRNFFDQVLFEVTYEDGSKQTVEAGDRDSYGRTFDCRTADGEGREYQPGTELPEGTYYRKAEAHTEDRAADYEGPTDQTSSFKVLSLSESYRENQIPMGSAFSLKDPSQEGERELYPLEAARSWKYIFAAGAEITLQAYDENGKSGKPLSGSYLELELTEGSYYYEILSKQEACEVTVQEKEAPAPVETIVAVGDVDSIAVSWNTASQIDTGYKVYRKAEGEESFALLTEISDRSITSWVDREIQEETEYTYYVTVTDGEYVESQPSQQVKAETVTDEEAPLITELLPESGRINGEIRLQAKAQDNLKVAEVRLFIQEDSSEEEGWTQLAASNSSECGFLLNTGDYPDGTYRVKAEASDTSGNKAAPYLRTYEIDHTGPAKVRGLSEEHTSVTVTLRWEDVADEDLSFYRVEEKQADGTWKSVGDTYSTLGMNLTGLTPSTAYTYRVAAYDTLGNRGEASEEITVTTAPDTASPVNSLIRPTTGAFRSSIPLTLGGSDDYGIVSMTLQVKEEGGEWKDQETWTYETPEKTVTREYDLDVSGMKEGKVRVRAVFRDQAGNISDTSNLSPFAEYVIDRTAPDSPRIQKSYGRNGYIELVWQQGEETDLAGYQVYRSDEREGTYVLLAEDIQSLNYFDREAQEGKTWWYKITAKDQAGNESPFSDPVRAEKAKDTEAPEIVSIYPASGEVMGEGFRSISVLAGDNAGLGLAKVWLADGDGEYQELSEKSLEGIQASAVFELPLQGLEDGAELRVKVSVLDRAGNASQEIENVYLLDLTAPAVAAAGAEYLEETKTVSLSWTGADEEDLSGYRILRKAREEENFREIARVAAEPGKTEYTWEDANPELGEVTYIYLIEGIDTAGNQQGIETEPVFLPDRSMPTAVIDCESVMETGVQYRISALNSRDNTKIVSYELNTGDGHVYHSAEAVHLYDETGTYAMSLTVTDEDGNTGTTVKEVEVREPKLLGTVKVLVQGTDGAPIPGASVYFDLGEPEQFVRTTGSDGTAVFTAEAGAHSVGCVVGNNEYLPQKKEVVASAGIESSLTFTMVRQPIVEGSFEIHRMTFEEIAAAGIDIEDPENQYLVKMTVHLQYGTTPYDLDMTYNPITGDVISRPVFIPSSTGGDGGRQLIPSVIDGGGGGTGSWNPSTGENVSVGILDVPVGTSILKEFFDVKLHILNNASGEFSMLDNEITLNVPEGLSVVPTDGTEYSAQASVPEIRGGTRETVNWILRGDEIGTYYLSADYRGTLSEFERPVTASFKAEEPIEVYGMTGMKLTMYVAEELKDQMLYFDLELKNQGEQEAYMPDVFSDDLSQMVYQEYFSASDELVLSPDETVMKPGERLVKHYQRSAEELDPALKYLQEYYVEAGNTYGLEFEIVRKPLSYFRAADDTVDITFDSMGGSRVAALKDLPKGKTFEEITQLKEFEDLKWPVPVKEGLYFAGWYESPDYEGEPVDPFTPLEVSMNLYAKWSKESVAEGSLSTKVGKGEYGIHFVNTSGEPQEGVKVTFGGQEGKTDEEGDVVFNRPKKETVSLKASKAGFAVWRNESYTLKEKPYDLITLYTKSEDPYALRKAVYNKGLPGSADLLKGKKRLIALYDEFGALDDPAFTISCYLSEGGIGDFLRMELWQSGEKIQESDVLSPEGCVIFEDLHIQDFQTGSGVFVKTVFQNNGAERSIRKNLNLELVASPDDLELSLGDSFSITVDPDIPLLGGMELSMDIPNLPIYVKASTDGTLAFGININKDNFKDKARREELKNLFDSVKNMKEAAGLGMGSKELKEKINEIRGDGHPKGTIDWGLVGYLEGQITREGEIGKVSGHVIVTITLSKKFNWQLPIPVPITAQVSLKGEGEGHARAGYDFSQNQWDLGLDTKITGTVEGFIGAGLAGIAAAGGFATGSTSLSFTNIIHIEEWLATLGGGFKVYAGPFEYKWTLAEGTWYLYSRNKALAARSLARNLAELPRLEVYEYTDRSYLEEQSGWLGEGVKAEPGETVPLLTETYGGSQPQIVSAGGMTLMVYRGDTKEAGRSAANMGQLMYSVYENGSWQTPKPVDSNDQADVSFNLYTDGSEIYLTYQEANQVFTEDVSANPEAYFGSLEIVTARFDRTFGAFTDFAKATQGQQQRYNSQPDTAVNQGRHMTVWVSNDTADLFGRNSTNEIQMRITGNGEASEIRTLQSGKNSILSLKAGVLEGAFAAAYVMDGDNDLNTAEDRILFLLDETGQERELARGTVTDPQFVQVPGLEGTALVWYQEGSLMMVRSLAGTPETLVDGSQIPVESGFRIVGNYILYIGSEDETSSNVYAVAWENGRWNPPVFVTDQTQHISSISAAEINGQICLVMMQNQQTVTGEGEQAQTQDHYTMSALTLGEIHKLVLESGGYDKTAAVPGTELPIVFTISNQGTSRIVSVEARVADAQGNVLGQARYDTDLASTGEQELTLNIRVPQTLDDTEYTLSVWETGIELASQNQMSFKMNQTDLAVAVETSKVGRYYEAVIEVTNQGHIAAGGTLRVYASKDQKLLKEEKVEILQPGESAVYQFSQDTLELTQSEDALTIELITDGADYDSYNNTYIDMIYQTYEVAYFVNGQTWFREFLDQGNILTFPDVPSGTTKFLGWYLVDTGEKAEEGMEVTDSLELEARFAEPVFRITDGQGRVSQTDDPSEAFRRLGAETGLQAVLLDTVTFGQEAVIGNGNRLTVSAGAELLLTENAVLTNRGVLQADGKLVSQGTLINEESFTVNGSFENNGILQNSGTLNNNGTLTNRGTIENSGNLYNNAAFNTAEGRVNGSGLFLNAGTLTGEEQIESQISTHIHVWAAAHTTDTEATCYQEGSRSRHCTVEGCQARTDVEKVNRTAHSYGEWQVIQEASLNETGLKARSCGICGHSETREIPNLTDAPQEMAALKVAGWKGAYDGAAHTLEITGAPEEARIVYYTAQGGTPLEEAPAYTREGLYTIWYEVSGEGWQTREGSVQIEITPCTHQFAEEFTIDVQPDENTAGSKSRHCLVPGCEGKTDITVLPAAGSVYAQMQEDLERITEENAGTEENKTLLESYVETVLQEESAALVADQIDIDTLSDLESKYLAAMKSESPGAAGETVILETVAELRDSQGEILEESSLKAEGGAFTAAKAAKQSGCLPEELPAAASKITLQTLSPSQLEDADLKDRIEAGDAVALDIRLSVVNAATGEILKGYEEIQPAAPLRITLSIPEVLRERQELILLHQKEDGTEEILSFARNEENQTITFTTASLSCFILSAGACTEHEYTIILDQKDPTCVPGWVQKQCRFCSAAVTESLPPVQEHQGGEADCLHRAVCEICDQEYGGLGEHRGGTATCQTLAVCEICGEEYGELGEHQGGTATCQKQAVCKICGKAYGVLADHSYSTAWTTDRNPTCTAAGSQSHHCTTPGCTAKTGDTAIPALGHTGGTATCQKRAVCSRCGAEYGNLGGHNYSTAWTKDLAPTCTASGSQSRHCTTPGCTAKTGDTAIPALGHTGGTATCQKRAVCSRCGAEYGNLGGHKYSASWTTDRNPTCTAAGSQSRHCTTPGCTAKTGSRTIAALGHSWSGYVRTKEPTALASGIDTRTCRRCGQTESRAVAKLKPYIKVSASSIRLQTRQSTTKLKVTAMAAGDKVASWKSSNTKIVKVSKSGKLTAQKKTGRATITITLKSGLKKKISVTVQKKKVTTTKISGLKRKITLQKGKYTRLNPVITPITSQDKIKYTTSNKKVAAVSSKGTVKAVGSGTAKITVRSGSKKYTVTVTVPKVKTKKITGVPSKKTLRRKKSFTLKPKLTPRDSSYKITYKSSNKRVATVTSKGKVTAKARGTAIITVKSGSVSVRCKVTVK